MVLKKNMCIEYLVVNPTIVYGGGEVYLYNLLQSVPKDRRSKFIIFAASQKLASLLISLGYRVELIPDSTRLSVSTLKLIMKIRSLVRNYNISSILLNGLTEIGVYSRFINFPKVYCVAHSNETWLSNKPYTSMAHFFKRLIICNFDRFTYHQIFVNDLARRNSMNYGELYNKSSVIYNGVPEITVKHDQRELKGNTIVFGRIGRLVNGKGNHNLIRSFAELVNSYSGGKNLQLLFAGIGTNEVSLSDLSISLGISSQVIFSGLISQKEFFSSIDIMISPSLMEATPLVIAESMSCKVPVIATNVGGVPEMIEHNKTGYLIQPNNLQELQESMDSFLKDPSRFYSYADKAYLVYKNKFSLIKMQKELSHLGLEFWGDNE